MKTCSRPAGSRLCGVLLAQHAAQGLITAGCFCSTKPCQGLYPHLLLLLSAGYYQKPTNHLSPWWPAAPISCSLSYLIKTVTEHSDKKTELQFITVTYLPDWALVSSRLSTQHNQNSLWEGRGSLKDGWACLTADFIQLSQENWLHLLLPLCFPENYRKCIGETLCCGCTFLLSPIFVVEFLYLSWQSWKPWKDSFHTIMSSTAVTGLPRTGDTREEKNLKKYSTCTIKWRHFPKKNPKGTEN